MAETSESLDATAIAQVSAAAKRLRDTATWTVTAVAAVATTVGGAITFAGLKDLDGKNFWIGAVGLVAIVVAALTVIKLIGGVLAPTDTQLSELKDSDAPKATKDLLLGEAGTTGENKLSTFAGAVDTAERALVAALRTPVPAPVAAAAEPPPVALLAVGPEGWTVVPVVAADPDVTSAGDETAVDVPSETPVSDAEIERLRTVAEIYGARAERIRLIVHFNELDQRWKSSVVPVLMCALLAAGGVVAYQQAGSRQRVATAAASAQAAAEKSNLPVLRSAPDLIVRFAPGALDLGIRERCASTRRAVEVPGQSKGQTGLLLRPKGTCGGRFVRVESKLIQSKTVARVRGG